MAYAPWSVVFGEQPSAAKWNILGTNDASFHDGTGISNLEIGSGHTAVALDYKFSVYRNSALTITTGGTNVTFDTEFYDTGSNHNTSTGTFTAPIAGFYQFNTSIGIVATASVTALIIELLVNSSEKHRLFWAANLNATTCIGSGGVLVQLAQNDTVNILAQTAGASAALSVGSPPRTWFTGYLQATT